MEQDFITGREQQKVSEQNRQAAEFLDDTVQVQPKRTDKSPPLMEASVLTFQQIAGLLFDDLPSESSRRVYRNTFQQWELFALRHDFNVVDLFYDNVKSFLYSRNLSYSTRLSRKSHMQRLLRVAAYLDPSFGIHYIQLRDLKIQGTSKDNAPRRKPRLLSRNECRQLLSVWKNDDSHKGIRNNAVLFLLLHTAVRNAELVALRWEDLNWDAQTLTLSRDNKDQACNIPILDASPDTINALRRLQLTQRSVLAERDMPFRFMFPALSTGMHARFTPSKDARTSTQTIRNIVKQTAEIAGLGKLSSLDLRYTSLSLFPKAGVSHADISSSADD